MPPIFPHAVFTPDDCLAVGGQIYTAGHLGRSIEGLRFQEDFPYISNEDLDDSVYGTLARILRECGSITTTLEMAEIISGQLLFPYPKNLTTYDELSRDGLVSILKSQGVTIPSKAKKKDLRELLKMNNSTPGADTPREELLKALQELYNKSISGI